jgi:hypothetical protein
VRQWTTLNCDCSKGHWEEHANWIKQKPLSVGDNVQVKIIETDVADRPVEQYRLDPTS